MADPDWNPWRRLLALPNESRTKTILVAFMVASVCALLVSGATVLLRPIQDANRAAEEQIRIETLVSGIPGMADLLAQAGGTLSTAVIDLATGQATTAVTPDTLAAALADTSNWTALSSDADIAGLGRRPNFAQVFLLRDGADISLVLLPISGMGYGGRIDAFIALRCDMNTIAGITVTSHSETPVSVAGSRKRRGRPAFPAPNCATRRATCALRLHARRRPAPMRWMASPAPPGPVWA